MNNVRSLFLVFVCMLTLIISEVTNASLTAKIAIEPAEVRDLQPGSTFNVNVTITDATNLYGWQVNITFNPNILDVNSTVEGPFLKQVKDTIFMKKIDNTAGYVLASATVMPPYPLQGANGSGVLLTINFVVKGFGVSPLRFVEYRTYLNTVIAGNIVKIDFIMSEGSFRNAAGGLLGIPLELVAGIVVVAVGAVSGFFLIRRRRKGALASA